MKTRQDVLTWVETATELGPEKMKSLRIAVTAMIFDSSGEKVLLQCRGPVSMDAVDCLEGIGGSLGQTLNSLEEALNLKLSEEIGDDCRFSPFEFLNCSHLQFESDGEWKDWAVVTFLCKLIGGTPIVGEPGRTIGIEWFDLAFLSSWKQPDDRRRVPLLDYDGKKIEKEAGLSIWVPTVIEAYIKKYGEQPWTAPEKCEE